MAPPNSPNTEHPRNRGATAIALIAVIVCGLATRSSDIPWPGFVSQHFGDALWTVAMYFVIALGRPGLAPWKVACLALGVSCAVEFAQLLRFRWLVNLRATVLGRLVLGSDFDHLDLVRYTAGAVLAWVVETSLLIRRARA